jgi:hypothetical protein
VEGGISLARADFLIYKTICLPNTLNMAAAGTPGGDSLGGLKGRDAAFRAPV